MWDERYLFERQAQRTADEDLLQTKQVIGVVETVSGARTPRRAQKPDLVVVVQRSHRDPGQVGKLAHAVCHAAHA